MSIDKNKIHAISLLKQQEELDNFINRINTLKEDINAKDHSSSQKEERTAGKVDLLHSYERELTFSKMEMSSLQNLDPSIVNTKVEPGAVVMTNLLNFYISIPIDKIEIDGTTYVGISVKAPIYAVMRDKKKGDEFAFNETEYKIIDLQ
jgi:hypothetical protein